MKSIFALFISALISGCQYDPFASQLTTHKPKRENIIGTYVFEQETINESAIDKNAKIILNSDSTFVASNIPRVTNQNINMLYGKWGIQVIGSIANGGQKDDDEWGLKMTTFPADLQHISFMGKQAPYKILITYGDADEGAVLILKKLQF